jgi:phospholipid/cholesterol/gamma-HCH transport system ATP-binding protein
MSGPPEQRPPVLEIDGARPAPDAAWADAAAEGELPAVDLRLCAGETALVEAPDQRQGRALIALCAGLPALAAGRACFLGQDWATLRRREAEALRGRIGHIVAENGGWLPHLSVAEGVLLPQLHHSRTPEAELRAAAAALARRFGLDGLPEGRPAELPAPDLARAACVRALLGDPALLLLDSTLEQGLLTEDELAEPLLDALAQAHRRGAGCVWLSARPVPAWDAPGLRGTRRYQLSADGLRPAGATTADGREAA